MNRYKREKSLVHRIFILFIILLLPVFFVREYRLIKSKKETRIFPAEDFSKVELSPIEDKEFTFIVLIKNNASSIKQNLDSILFQKYDKYKVVYLDLGSSDGSLDILKKASEGKGISIIECTKNYEAYEKYYELISKSPDDQIIIHLYGTDWLVHDEVLQRVSQAYSNPDVWLTYGQYLDYSSYQNGFNDPKPKKNIYKKRMQKASWVMAPFKTFYAGLFKKLDVETGFFLSIEDENALLIPMAELAKTHVRFIPDVLFIHNENTKRKRHRLAFVEDHMKTTIDDNMVELMIFSDNTPQDLKRCLESCSKHLMGISKTHVIYRCKDEAYAGYEMLREAFPEIAFIRSFEKGISKELIIHSLWGNNLSPPYVLLSTDQIHVKQPIALSVCINAMRKTQAYGFYFHLGREEPVIQEGIYSWNIQKGEGNFKRPDTLQMALYRRLDLEKDLQKLSFQSIHDLIDVWANQFSHYRVGLSFNEARVTCASSAEKQNQS